MNATLLERLRGFQIPANTALEAGSLLVAQMQGLDFEGIIDSPEFGFTQPFDARFSKMMIRTASHLLGGEACGRYAFVEQLEISVVLGGRAVHEQWRDACELQSYLVALASSKMSLEVEDEALFNCRLYAFTRPELVIAYLMWRQQEAYLVGLDRYCAYVLARDGANVAKIMDGLGPLEKEEILRQNNIDSGEIPAWQRYGAAVFLTNAADRVTVETNLPRGEDYPAFLAPHVE